MEEVMDLKAIPLDELAGVVNRYPWFSAARMELCRRMSLMGDWGDGQYAEAALYIPSRRKVAILRSGAAGKEYPSAEVEKLLKSYVAETAAENPAEQEEQGRKVYVVGGDYFSQAQYDKVKGQDAGFRFTAKEEYPASHEGRPVSETDYYTETLAAIYAEQGYYEQAMEIYSKLILAYPEKSVYFATLIDKLTEIKNK